MEFFKFFFGFYYFYVWFPLQTFFLISLGLTFLLLYVVGRARASFRQSFRFGNMALRDRGHRLAGYLTPPSDATQEEEEAASERAVPCDTNRFGFFLFALFFVYY